METTVATQSTSPASLYLTPVHVLVGVGLAVTGNVIISAALNIQKYVHVLRLRNHWGGKSMFQIPLWWLGILLMLIGEVGNFAAYGFAPASVVAPLGAVCIIANMFIAVIFLKESLRVENIFACGLIGLGSFLIVLFSEDGKFGTQTNDNAILTNKEIVQSLKQPAFLVYTVIELSILVACFVLYYKYEMKCAILFLLICCILASFTVMSAKGLSGLIQISVRGYNQFYNPVPYVLLVTMIVTALAQVVYLNKALELYNATVIVPTNYVLFTISAILSAVVFYREMWEMQVVNVLTFLIGCLLSSIGVYLLTFDALYHDSETRTKSDDSNPESDADGDAEFSPMLQPASLTPRRSSKDRCLKFLQDLCPCWFVERVIVSNPHNEEDCC